MKKFELPLVGTKGILKVWVRGSSEANCEERGERLRVRVSFVAHREVDGDWFGCVRVSFVACQGVEGDWFGCLSESVWTLRVCLRVFDWECLSEAFESGCIFRLECANFESYKLDFYVAKFSPSGKFVHVRVWQTPEIEF